MDSQYGGMNMRYYQMNGVIMSINLLNLYKKGIPHPTTMYYSHPMKDIYDNYNTRNVTRNQMQRNVRPYALLSGQAPWSFFNIRRNHGKKICG